MTDAAIILGVACWIALAMHYQLTWKEGRAMRSTMLELAARLDAIEARRPGVMHVFDMREEDRHVFTDLECPCRPRLAGGTIVHNHLGPAN